MKVQLSKLKVDPNQPRKTFDQVEMDDLIQSIEANDGKLLYPVIVDKNFVIIDGERRYRAYQSLQPHYSGKFDEIEVSILNDVDTSDEVGRLKLQIVADIQHKKLPILERDAAWYQLWLDLGKPEIAILAQLIGVKETPVRDSIERTEFLASPHAPKLQEFATGMSISRTQGIKDEKIRSRVVEKLNTEGIRNKTQIDTLVRSIKSAPDKQTVEAILNEPVNPDTKVAARMIFEMQYIREQLTGDFVNRLPAQTQYSLLAEIKMLLAHLRTYRAVDAELA
jgi:ParB/RepB/Spo0J family partition protein